MLACFAVNCGVLAADLRQLDRRITQSTNRRIAESPNPNASYSHHFLTATPAFDPSSRIPEGQTKLCAAASASVPIRG
jgi:hypothetical protein